MIEWAILPHARGEINCGRKGLRPPACFLNCAAHRT